MFAELVAVVESVLDLKPRALFLAQLLTISANLSDPFGLSERLRVFTVEWKQRTFAFYSLTLASNKDIRVETCWEPESTEQI